MRVATLCTMPAGEVNEVPCFWIHPPRNDIFALKLGWAGRVMVGKWELAVRLMSACSKMQVCQLLTVEGTKTR